MQLNDFAKKLDEEIEDFLTRDRLYRRLEIAISILILFFLTLGLLTGKIERLSYLVIVLVVLKFSIIFFPKWSFDSFSAGIHHLITLLQIEEKAKWDAEKKEK